MQLTIDQLVTKLGLNKEDRINVNGWVQLHLKTNTIKLIGNAPRPEGSKGKSSKLYEISDELFNALKGENNVGST